MRRFLRSRVDAYLEVARLPNDRFPTVGTPILDVASGGDAAASRVEASATKKKGEDRGPPMKGTTKHRAERSADPARWNIPRGRHATYSGALARPEELSPGKHPR